MSPLLSTQVTNQSSIQRLGTDQVRRTLAFLLTAYGAGAYGQSPVLSSPDTKVVANAKTIVSKFQGFNAEQFLDAQTYLAAVGVKAFLSTGLQTDGFALNDLVNTYWGGSAGIVDAQDVDALLMYGVMLQQGFNFQNILTT